MNYFHQTISTSVRARKRMSKKSKEDEHTLEELITWTHRRSQAKRQLVETSYIKRIEFFLFLSYNKHLINRAKLVCMGES